MKATEHPFSLDRTEFKGKRILVTGGTKGMGEAIVRRLTMGGGSVATTARSPLPEGQQPAMFVQKDIGTADGVQAVVDRLLMEWHGVDILVNCVGGSEAPKRGLPVVYGDDWQKGLNVKFVAAGRVERGVLAGIVGRP